MKQVNKGASPAAFERWKALANDDWQPCPDDQAAIDMIALLQLAFFAYGLHALTSDNLWDYLLDPVLVIVLGISVFRGVMSHRFKSTA